jgi:hypothetical protein
VRFRAPLQGGTRHVQAIGTSGAFTTSLSAELSEPVWIYLSKQFTIFCGNVHVGCPDTDTALLTLHPHVALASSPCRRPAPVQGKTPPSTRPG